MEKEYEKKIIITAQEYNLIRFMGFGFGAAEIHTNYYYDTDDFYYNKRRTTLRIREQDEKYTATIKKHSVPFGSFSIEEYGECTNEYDTALFSGYGVKLQGSLETERSISEPEHGLRIMLDRNRYLGGVDHEIEFEYDPERKEIVDFYIEAIGRCLVEQGLVESVSDFTCREGCGKCKSERFFDVLRSHVYDDDDSSCYD